MAWDGESKRIIAVGDGRETYVQKGYFLFLYSILTKAHYLLSGFNWEISFIPVSLSSFGKAFMFDTGSSTGEIGGHAKVRHGY